MSKEYDVFISHANEDEDEFVRPLVKELRLMGLIVWHDESELGLGSALRKSIDHGLANSSFGVVVVSRHYFNRDWPHRELNALFAKEEAEKRTIILPIWHGVDQKYVANYSPLLAGNKAIDSRDGVEAVARHIYNVAKTEPEILTGNGPIQQGSSHSVLFTVGANVYTVDAVHRVMDVAPFIVTDSDDRGRTFVPVYYLATAMGVESDNVFLNISKSTMIIIKDPVSITVTVGSTVSKVNGVARIMDVAPLLVNGQIMLPPRWVAPVFGGQVGWNPTTQQVLVLY